MFEGMQVGLIAGGIVIAVIVLVLLTISRLIVIAPPNMAAAITGRKRVLEDGSSVGYRTVSGGRTIRVPIIERVQWLSLGTIALEINVQDAYSRGNVPLAVQAVANVKIASTPESVFNNAVERLLGKDIREIEGLARETLTGNLRGVLATLTPEEVNEDRLKFASQLIDEADTDLAKLGLHLDVLKVQNVADERGYLEAIGREKTAEVLQRARVAEAENDRKAKVAEAENNKTAEVAESDAQIAIVEARNRVRVRQAELDQEAMSKEKVAAVEATRAEVEAQRELEAQRIEMERKRQDADVVVPAEAARRAAEENARAIAAPIRERGKAQAEALHALYEEIKQNGEQGFKIFMAEKLPALFEQAAKAVEGVDIDRLIVMDGGESGGVGNAAYQRVGGAMRFMEGIAGMVGISPEELAGRLATGNGGNGGAKEEAVERGAGARLAQSPE